MPVQPSDTSNDRLQKSGPDVWDKKDRNKKESDRDIDAEDIQANYGFARDAELNTAAEETEDQEYMADGLPKTQQYSIDKVGRSHDMNEERSNRKEHTDCGC